MTRLRRAALLALATHLIAGLSMALILRHGLATTPDLRLRMAFLVNHRAAWTFAWLTWTAADASILYFYLTFAGTRLGGAPFAVILTVAGLAPDFTAQAVEIGVLPGLVSAPELFLTLDRVAVMLSGYLANGLFSATALILSWRARHAYPAWVTGTATATGIAGIALSVAALKDSVAGMFWTNSLLVPGLLLWLAGVALLERKPD